MENASKALIIAGAILLSILIIGLGMFIFTQAAGQIEDSNIDAEKVKAFNSKFLNYEGSKTGVQVKQLLNEISASNSTNDNKINVTNATAKITNKNDNTSIATVRTSIKNSQKYTVTFTYATSGLITGITIK